MPTNCHQRYNNFLSVIIMCPSESFWLWHANYILPALSLSPPPSFFFQIQKNQGSLMVSFMSLEGGGGIHFSFSWWLLPLHARMPCFKLSKLHFAENANLLTACIRLGTIRNNRTSWAVVGLVFFYRSLLPLINLAIFYCINDFGGVPPPPPISAPL